MHAKAPGEVQRCKSRAVDGHFNHTAPCQVLAVGQRQSLELRAIVRERAGGAGVQGAVSKGRRGSALSKISRDLTSAPAANLIPGPHDIAEEEGSEEAQERVVWGVHIILWARQHSKS